MIALRSVTLLAALQGTTAYAVGAGPARMLSRSAMLRGGAKMLAEGDALPSAEFMIMEGGPKPLASSDVFSGKKVVLFGLPGAMTPTCSEQQLPGFVKLADDFKAKGVDTIACVAVNDPFVLGEWSKMKDPQGKVLMLGDGGGAFTKATGLSFDTGNFGGVRMVRCAMVVDDGKVVKLGVEEGGAFDGASSAESMLAAL